MLYVLYIYRDFTIKILHVIRIRISIEFSAFFLITFTTKYDKCRMYDFCMSQDVNEVFHFIFFFTEAMIHRFTEVLLRDLYRGCLFQQHIETVVRLTMCMKRMKY